MSNHNIVPKELTTHIGHVGSDRSIARVGTEGGHVLVSMGYDAVMHTQLTPYLAYSLGLALIAAANEITGSSKP